METSKILQKYYPDRQWSMSEEDPLTLNFLDGLPSIPIADIKGKEVDYLKWVSDTSYIKKRLKEYPPIGDQLDMLWHAMDAGKLPKDNDFYMTLKAIKDKYPKPVGV